jgi:DNA-binding response OmpR family regulator
MAAAIAYIDDSQANLECLKLVLDKAFNVLCFQHADEFLKTFSASSYSAILIDIHMPEISGFDLCEKIMELDHYNGCPIIFISSDDTDQTRLTSFNLGAVDFINRRISNTELLSRLTSKISFYQNHKKIIELNRLKMDLTSIRAYLGEVELKLTFTEFKILSQFIQQYPGIITKEDFVKKVWNQGHVLDATIYTHVSNLNNKISSWDFELCSIRGRGFTLVEKKQR